MQELQNYLKIPHYEAVFSRGCKYGVFGLQLCRFARRPTCAMGFKTATARSFRALLVHGYKYQEIRTKFYRFRAMVVQGYNHQGMSIILDRFVSKLFTVMQIIEILKLKR